MIPCDTIPATSSAATGSSPLSGCGVDDWKQTTRTDEAGSCTRVSGARRRRLKRRARALRSSDDVGGNGGQIAPGVLLGDWGTVLSRADMIAIRTAVRRDRIQSPAARKAFCDLLHFSITRLTEPRHTIAAALLAIDMDEANIRGMRRDLARAAELFPLDGGNPS